MTHSPTPTSQTRSPSALLRVIIFPIDRLWLAISLDRIYKILRYTDVYGSGLNEMGFTHSDNQDITVVDLHQRLFNTRISVTSAQRTYLITLQNSQSELFGIPVITLPTLLELPLSQVRVLPPAYRQSDTLGIASHVAIASEQSETAAEEKRTIFILDVDRLVIRSGMIA